MTFAHPPDQPCDATCDHPRSGDATEALARRIERIESHLGLPMSDEQLADLYQAAEAADREAAGEDAESPSDSAAADSPCCDCLCGNCGAAYAAAADPRTVGPYSVDEQFRRGVGLPSAAADSLEWRTNLSPAKFTQALADAAALDVEALAAALQALCDGPRRIQIVENDVEGMGSLVWPNEYADLLAAAYAAAKPIIEPAVLLRDTPEDREWLAFRLHEAFWHGEHEFEVGCADGKQDADRWRRKADAIIAGLRGEG